MACDVLFTESSPHLGGQELQLLQQMAALQARGFSAALACRPGSEIAGVASQRGLRTLELALSRGTDVPSLVALRRFIIDEGVRAVIGHSGHDANLGLLAGWSLSRRPRILRAKTYLAGRNPSPWTHSRLVDTVLVPSAWLRNALLQAPGIRPERVAVLHPGIDFARLQAQCRDRLPDPLEAWLASGSGPLIVQVGMLRGEKGHAQLLPALADALASHPRARYVAAGAGPEQVALEHLASSLGLADRVRFLPVHPVAPLLARADLLLMPSTYEPLGMAQIEALGLGVPVLASRTGGIPETVRDEVTGRLLPPNDRAAWATAVSAHLADQRPLRQMAQRGQADVRARFSIEANTEALLRYCGLGESVGRTQNPDR